MRWISRRPSGPPATGSGVRSALQQQRIMEEAFTDRSAAPALKKTKSKVRA
jgi:hypothetical protein